MGKGGKKGGCALPLYELSDSCFCAIWSPLGDDDTRCVIWFSLKLDGEPPHNSVSSYSFLRLSPHSNVVQHNLAAQTCDHGDRRGQCDTCAATAELPPVLAGADLLHVSDPRWDVVVACAGAAPRADASASEAIPSSFIELLEQRRATEMASVD